LEGAFIVIGILFAYVGLITAIVYVADNYLRQLFHPLTEWLDHNPWVGIVSALILPALIAFYIARGLWNELAVVRQVSRAEVATREQIATIFFSMNSEYGRRLFVNKVAAVHRTHGTMPSGEWPSGDAPGLKGSVAATRLGQFDEKWSGLDR
jgi:hypothetical protein